MAAFADEELFKRDLNEVHLLIDFISGRADKSLAGLTEISNYDASGVPMTPPLSAQAVVAQICAITYPPTDGPAANAREAAFMLVVKDRLNALADPARGLTIAFTSMFAGVSLPVGEHLGRRLAKRMLKRPASTTGTTSAPKPGFYASREAYPNLEIIASRFRSFFWRQPFWALALIAAITLVNWDISTSSAVLQQIAAADTEYAKLFTPDHGFSPWPDKCARPSVPLPSAADRAAHASATTKADANDAKPGDLRVETAEARSRDISCHAATDALARKASGLENLDDLIHRDLWFTSVVATGVHLSENAKGTSCGSKAATVDQCRSRLQSLTLDVVNALNTVVIPVMFGWLGTLVGVMRSITIKVRDSILAPRDFALARISIFLGMTAGLTVGLFFNAADASGGLAKTLGGNISVSAASLAFLAGFGAEAFFAFLDAALVRLMPTSTTPPAPAPHPYSGQPAPTAPITPIKPTSEPE